MTELVERLTELRDELKARVKMHEGRQSDKFIKGKVAAYIFMLDEIESILAVATEFTLQRILHCSECKKRKLHDVHSRYDSWLIVCRTCRKERVTE